MLGNRTTLKYSVLGLVIGGLSGVTAVIYIDTSEILLNVYFLYFIAGTLGGFQYDKEYVYFFISVWAGGHIIFSLYILREVVFLLEFM